ncbi:hypothetical protein Moror_12331 [Moniliophthora roreri MCA 2997]|uniref:Uncharacterized protein n=2 Tax=Moniliophthora roreri TaxID=221103 RepID=V2X9R4_MONRO|nr:hypothetical protein Moror_12331 [Moniliophthora roreri MCA 2997]KAI3615994.1 hypothetical protein WG66_010237 [Moniliophthora roreri]
MNRTTLPAPTPSSQKVLVQSRPASNIQQPRVAYKHRQAGPGTTRPPLPRNPSESLLKSMAMQASEITAMEPNPYEALASPIHLAQSISRTAASQVPRMSPYGYQFFTPSSAGGVPASSPSNLQHPTAIHAQRNAAHTKHTSSTLSHLNTPTAMTSTPVPYTPNPRRPSPNGSGSITVSTPVNVKPGIQQSGRQAPMLLSPLKVTFDNACRGIYSELSYLQSSCTAMMNRERKEKEMIRAHYFQMKRERDAAREQVRILEDERRSSSPEQKHSISQGPPVNPRKREREGSESSSSSSSSGSLPRTPSPPAQTTNEIVISDQYELVYPPGRSYTSSSSPPPSISKAFFTPPSTPSLNVSLSSIQPTLSSVPPRSAASSPSSRKSPVHRSSGTALKRSPSPGAMPNLDMPSAAKRRKVTMVICSTEDDAASIFRQGSFDTETSSGDRRVATSTVITHGELDKVDMGSEGDAIGVTGNGSVVESSPRPVARSPSHSPKPSLSLPSLHDMYPGYTFS